MPLLPVANVGQLAADLAGQSKESGYEVHLNLGQIQGESNSSAHLNEIEVVSFSWGCSNTAVASAQGGTTKGGKASVSELNVVKYTDKATPLLFSAVMSCQTFPTATISLSKSTGGKKPEDYYIIKLQSVIVTSLQQASPSGAELGTETITLNFGNINLDYKMQTALGILVSAATGSYDLKGGK
jgi:type VI secretion system secreted protein Hcp